MVTPPALMNSCDEPVTAGDKAKFRSCCAWSPKIRLATTVRDMLEWWRSWLNGAASPISSQEVTGTHDFGHRFESISSSIKSS
jgi:hypothetical protein